MRGTARHYDTDMGIDRYEDAEVSVVLDDDIIRIEALHGDPENFDWGRPGISLELSIDAAIELMADLSEVTLHAVTPTSGTRLVADGKLVEP